jgi:hypothetical protein
MQIKHTKRHFRFYWFTLFGIPTAIWFLWLFGSANANPLYWVWILMMVLVLTDVTARLMWKFFEWQNRREKRR